MKLETRQANRLQSSEQNLCDEPKAVTEDAAEKPKPYERGWAQSSRREIPEGRTVNGDEVINSQQHPKFFFQ